MESKAARSVSGEIRAHFKGLTTGERMAQIQQAIRDGDETTATAVLGGPAYLSGLDNEMKAILLREWHERSNPDLARKLRAVESARELIDSKVSLLRKEVRKAVGEIQITKEVSGGRTVVVKTLTPGDVRAAKRPLTLHSP